MIINYHLVESLSGYDDEPLIVVPVCIEIFRRFVSEKFLKVQSALVN